jgi:hypothetical protein
VDNTISRQEGLDVDFIYFNDRKWSNNVMYPPTIYVRLLRRRKGKMMEVEIKSPTK